MVQGFKSECFQWSRPKLCDILWPSLRSHLDESVYKPTQIQGRRGRLQHSMEWMSENLQPCVKTLYVKTNSGFKLNYLTIVFNLFYLIVYFLVLAYMFSLGLTGCFLLFFCLFDVYNNRMFLIPPSYSLYHWCHAFNLYISIYKPIQGLPLVARTVKNPPAMTETRVQSLGWGDPLEREWQRNGSPLQYSCLEKSKDREARQATVHGVAKSQMWLSN